MRNGTARVLLKARPTPEQIRDRLSPPRPDGLELYLDVHDIAGAGWLEGLRRTVCRYCPDGGFALAIEGPLRSLDGSFFDLSRDSEANREVVRRVVQASKALRGQVAVLHLIAPRLASEPSGRGARQQALEEAVGLASFYAEGCMQAGVVPTLENVPPIARMRENGYYQSLVGMDPTDLLFMVSQVPGLRLTLDVSHAQLYLNCLRGQWETQPGESLLPELKAVLDGLRCDPEVRSIDDYILAVEDCVENVHVSNARGVLGEGLPYDDGDLDLDSVVSRLACLARCLVTETIEPDPERAFYMRQAQTRMLTVLGRWPTGAPA